MGTKTVDVLVEAPGMVTWNTVVWPFSKVVVKSVVSTPEVTKVSSTVRKETLFTFPTSVGLTRTGFLVLREPLSKEIA